VNRLSNDIVQLIYEMDPTFHILYRKCMRDINLLPSRHIMNHYCRIFFQGRAVPCEVGIRNFRLYLFSRRRAYLVTYDPFALLEKNGNTVVCLRRHDTRTGFSEPQEFLYQHEVGFGILRHYTISSWK